MSKTCNYIPNSIISSLTAIITKIMKYANEF